MKDEHKIVLLRAALIEAATQFRYYEKQHLAKGTPESRTKADVNATLARSCEGILEATK